MKIPFIGTDPKTMSGAVDFTGTRVLVQNLCDCIEGSSWLEDFLEDFPSVTREASVEVLEVANAQLFADATSS